MITKISRRLAQYRNASRRKAHRKMREIIRVAHALEVRPVESEAAALLRENELIREHRPEFNVDGAYDFLYPAIGLRMSGDQLWLCFSSRPEAYDDLDLQWHGCFRPRWRAREAFDALVSLCGRIGHLEPKSHLPELPAVRGTRFVALRRMGAGWDPPTRAFFDGESDELLTRLFEASLEKRGARIEAASVQAELESLRAFYDEDARRLHDARLRVGWPGSFVPQGERDALFIRARAERDVRGPALQAGM